jgi:hypothetical protein
VHDDGSVAGEVWAARRIAAEAIVARIADLEGEAWVDGHHAAILRKRYLHMLEEIPDSGDDADFDRDHVEAHERLREDVIDMAREAVIRARNEGRIGDAARFLVEMELDREVARTEF